VEHPGTRAVDTTPPRDGEGVRVGLYGGSDIEAAPYDQQARFDFARFEPDEQNCGNCLRSDEFDGAALDARWLRHTRNGGTPTEGPTAPTLSGGQLLLPTNDFELDGASGTTSVGPVNFIGQDLAALGENWEVETQFTIAHNGGWQNVGLAVWNGDNNFFRSSITNSLTASERTIYIEQSKDNPTTTEGARVQAGGNVNALVGQPVTPVTIKMRYARVDGANSVTGQYQITAPESIAMDDWADFPATNTNWINSGGLDLNPAGGPRRDAPGSRIGIIAGSNFPGSTGNFPYGGTPAVAEVDYFRVTPDECSEEDTEAPTTTATLDPAEPGPGGTYNEPVTVLLSAVDNEGGSGVEETLYRVDGGEWLPYDLLMPPTISAPGAHTVDFYSVDAAGNEEDPPGSVSFTIAGTGDDTTPPVTTHELDPPGGGPYDGPVDVTLSATDPDEGTEPANHDVFASGTTWDPNQVDLAQGDDVTWHFDEPDAVFPHDVWLVPPGGDPDPEGDDIFQVTDGPVSPGGEPVSETFGQVGAWEYICRLHSGFSGGEWVGMVGDADVAEGGGGGASGVASTTYSIDGGADVVVENTNADDPFETTFTVSEPGEHTITYLSTDNAGNAEEEKTVTFTIEEEEPGGPELDLSVKPRRQTVKARDKAKFTATLTNLGDEAAADVELCAKAPKRLVEVKGKECATASSLEPDADMAPEFTFKPTNKARGKKVEITFTANSSNADPAMATAELKVRSKR
jgi:plastocyanin